MWVLDVQSDKKSEARILPALLCSRNVMIRWELGQGHSGSLTVSVIKLIEITSNIEYGSKHQYVYSGKTYFCLFGNFRLTM